MARGKKKETMMPEERLQAALVPEREQPYPVPGNWCWIQLGELYQINPKNLAEDFVDAAFIPMEKIAPGFVNEYSFDVQPWCKAKKGHTQFADGDVAFAKISPCFENRKSMLLNNLPNGIGGGTTELVILRQSHMNQKYTFWFISQEQFIRGGIATYSGTVGQQRISMDYVRTYPIPVPPLPEQQRIVDRIESLFAKLDEAKQKAQDALDSFETRKAAILHKAFAGELTVQWRKEHGTGMESWQTKKYSEICNIVRGGSPRPAGSLEFYGGNIPFMKVADITRNTGPYVNSTEYTIKEAGLKKTRMVDRNTLLLTNSGATLGVPAICTFKTTFNDGIAAFLGLNPDTLLFHYYFWTSKTAALRAINKGAAQPNLNTDIIGNVEISLPRENEQCEIVRLLDNLLAKEQQAKEAAEGVLEQIDLIKKAILARAFRGELGTNDPSEESAVELLKQISSY